MKGRKIIVLGVLLLGAWIATVGGLLATKGRSTDVLQSTEENLFGGYGTLHTPVHRSTLWRHYFYDDTCIYFQPGSIRNGLVALDTETGVVRSVCQRPLCLHSSSRCILYNLYVDGNLYYFPVDDVLYCYQRTGGELLLQKWDILKQTLDIVAELPGTEENIDASGNIFQRTYSITGIERINADTILVLSNGMALFDNHFKQKAYIPLWDTGNVTWTEHALFWGQRGDFCFYDLDTDTLHENILAQAGELSKAFSQYFYAYDNRLYFMLNRRIVCYDLADGSISDMGLPTLPKKIEERDFRILDGRLFYRNKDKGVRCRDLRTGADTALPDMQDLPTIQTDKYLVQYRGTSLEDGGWRCSCILFDLNGKKVKEFEEFTVTP